MTRRAVPWKSDQIRALTCSLLLSQAVLVTRMRVDPRHIDEFERLLRMILKNTHTIGHVSTCVVKPPPGEYTYTSIVRCPGSDGGGNTCTQTD